MEEQWKKNQEKNGEIKKKITDTCQIEIVTMEVFQERYPNVFRRSFIHNGLKHIRFCKADRWNKFVAGTFALPSKQDPSKEKTVFGYCLSEECLIFIDNYNYVKTILNEMQEYELTDMSSPSLFLFSFMEYLIRDDVLFLQEYEEKLTQLEEELLNGNMDEFDEKILASRKDLSALSAYYEQLSDLGESLQQNAAEKGAERECTLFELYSDRTGRLYSTVQMLKEYSMQLREMHQTQIDVRQNEIMKVLTIVTTIFMPLTLIAGWYGMNFINMPELSSPHGYIIICGICFLIIAIEVWIFAIKKWFR